MNPVKELNKLENESLHNISSSKLSDTNSTEIKTSKWIDPCRICKNEVCGIVDHFVKTKQASSVRDATRILSEQIDGEIPPNTLRQIYSRKKLATNVATFNPPKLFKTHSECKTVSCLDDLIKEGKTFSTIYADPPWKYGNQATRSATDGEYPTLNFEQLCALPISNLSTDNDQLHTWVTSSFIHEGLHLMESWGFEYKSSFIWIKTQLGIGNYWRLSHEFLLLGVKGNLTFNNCSLISWLEAKRTRHSVKPEIIRTFIQLASPPEYLELFGRRPVKGWTVFGNQIEKNMFDEAQERANVF